MVKDYAKLNSQSLKAAVVPAKSVNKAQKAGAFTKKPQESKPLPIVAALLTIVLALLLVAGIYGAYKHREAIFAFKERVITLIHGLHHDRSKTAADEIDRQNIDQSVSDPTQSLAADNSQQALNLPANINLNSLPSSKKKPKPAPAQAPQPVFDFYTVLPSGSAADTNSTAASSSQPTPPPSTTPPNSQAAAKFVVDVGYYQDSQSANQMRSQLLLMGFNPTIKNTGSITSPVYQAELGPFDNLTQANQIRQQLQSNNVSNIVVRPI